MSSDNFKLSDSSSQIFTDCLHRFIIDAQTFMDKNLAYLVM